MEDFLNKELFTTIILKCVEKRSEISERLIRGYWNAIFNKYFSENESEVFFTICDTIKVILSDIDEDKIIEHADHALTDSEKQYCYDLCIDICNYKNEYSSYKDSLQYTTKIARRFNLSIPAQVERLKLLSIPEASDCIIYTSTYNFALIIPESWEILEDIDDKTKVAARKRNLTTVDTFAENINIGLESAYNIDLDSYINLSKTNMVQSFTEYILIHERDFNFQNGMGYHMEYAFKMAESGILNSKSYIFINKNIAYTISGISTEDSSSEYAEIFDEIAKSFILIN